APGERVLDLCAAPGGKSTQLATALSGKGLLIANEIHAGRCRILAQNIERMGISNAVVTNEDCEKLALRFPAYFHKILVDAPCSGEGMFRKNPDAMQQWSLEQVKVCADRQRDILHQAAGMLMPGGTLVYSTCTFSPEENEGVISRLINEHEELELVKAAAPWFDPGRPAWADGREELNRCFRLFPHHLRGEGHFAAVLHKKGEIPKAAPIKERRSAKALKGVPDQAMMQVFREFCAGTLSEETERFLLSGRLVLFGDQLYRLPDDAPSLDGLRVLRAGLHIGTFQKKRFEPSHALALFLGRRDVKNCVQLFGESGDTAAYFRGETLQAQDDQGFCLVCVDGFSAGWGKLAGGRLKNHYPKGLRKDFGDC
ncbi:MAG: RsmF rRNA methyltransferase first C-terminal domain-containing protein, partial [Lachnospiraceae bacterium]|nr:RsmF rRNA methyltransferase first C-terminal domain-containing protein [Lachnospiraceae bacterium]